MGISPIARQLLVATSTQFAALSSGGVLGYPAILLQQLQSNDTIIELNLHKRSWIGSVHGIAGIASILLLLLMQYRGRRIAFILSCLFIAIGWIIIYIAQDITAIIIGECSHGLGTNSLIAVSGLSVSEMVDKKYRNIVLILYCSGEALGITMVGILGGYLHWKTVGLIMSCPIFISLLMGCLWPESPSWLACRGKYKECERSFKSLRGTNEESNRELKELIDAQNARQPDTSFSFGNLKNTFVSRDFYLPCLHTLLLVSIDYWGGGIPVVVYSYDMFIKMSGEQHEEVKLVMNIVLFVGYNIASLMVRYFSSKKIMLYSMSGSAVFMIAAAVVTILQSMGIVTEGSVLGVYCILGYTVSWSLGVGVISLATASEIMPVKYRGFGGCLYVICVCMYHASSLKAYPYISVYMNVWRVFLIYGFYTIISSLLVWKFVPDTTNRTLQEIEDYYVNGYFKVKTTCDADAPLIKSELNK